MKWRWNVLRLLVVIVLIVQFQLLSYSTPIQAAPWEADVIITVTPEPPPPTGLTAPTNLILTDLGGSTALAEWTVGNNSTYTMLRMGRETYPTSIDEGELVYYDTGSSTNITGLSLDVSTYYVTAWAFQSDNITNAGVATANVGGESMALIAYIILATALTVVAYVLRKPLLAFAGAGAWLILGIYAYTQSVTPASGTWDIYFALFFLSMGMVLACVLEPAIMRAKKEEQEDVYLDDIDNFQKEYDDIQKQTRIPRIGGKKKRTYGRIRR